MGRFLLGLLLGFLSVRAAAQKPNVIVILCDDLGYGDVQPFANDGTETPNLLRMSKEGVTFTSFLVPQPVCSASRAALLTGCYPNRVGISGALFPGDGVGLHTSETTMAEMFRNAGYRTAIFGKWHLGEAPRHLPMQHGFDEFVGIPYSNDMWPHGPVEVRSKYPELPLFRNEEQMVLRDQSHLTNLFTREATGFIRESVAHDKPFFIYLSHPQPHVPLYVSPEFEGASGRGLYGDVIAELDWSVGEIFRQLQESKVAENTLVIFTSDNGPWSVYGDHGGATGRLRGHKGTNWEGGVRVPCLMHWPGKIPAGLKISAPLMTIDLLPTFASLAGGNLSERRIDGKDALELITGETDQPVQESYAFYYGDNELQAIRSGDWKLVFPHKHRDELVSPGRGGKSGKYGASETGLALFDLRNDIEETTNLASRRPEVVTRLKGYAEHYRSQLGDGLTGSKGEGVRRADK